MEDIRVLVFFYIVEAGLMVFVGTALLNIRLSFKQIAAIGIVQGTLVYIIRSLCAIYGVPAGVNIIFSIPTLFLVVKWIVGTSWGVSVAATLISIIVVLVSEGLSLPIILNAFELTLEEVMGNTWRHIAMGYLGDWLLILLAVFLALTKKVLIDISVFSSKG